MAYRGAQQPRGGPSAGAGSGGPKLAATNANARQASPATGPRGWSSPAQQHQPQSAAATASAFPSLAGASPNSKSDGKMKDRTLFVLVSLVGNTVVATTKTGRQFVGILHSTSNDEAELGVVLSCAQEIKASDTSDARAQSLGSPTKLLVIRGPELDTIVAPQIVLGEPAKATSANGFRTDVEISAREADDRLNEGRALTAWNDDAPPLSTADGQLDGADATNSSLASTNNRSWDQFAANEARFGIKSNYDEDMYTTKLDRSRKNFKEEEKKAERLAAEIMGQASTNTHMAEERGQVDDSGQNEEDKYGAVVRGPGAYVPPAARKSAEAASTAIPNTTNGSSAAATTASPRVVLQESSEKKAAAVPGIAVKVPTPTKAPAEAAATAKGPTGTESTSPNSTNANPLRDFHQFVASEKARVQTQRMAAREQQKRSALTGKSQPPPTKQEMLNDLKAWSTSFKLKTPIPDDVASAGQQSSGPRPAASTAGLQKSLSPTTAHTQSTAGLNKAAGTASAVPSPSGGAGSATAAGVAPPAKNNLTTASRPDKLSDSKALLANMAIPKIPPFKAKPAAASVQQQQSQTKPATGSGIPSSGSSTFKMSAKASAFKPFNPAAPSFTPGASVKPAAAATPLAPAAGAANAPPPNPFFGNRIMKMSPVPIHVREDFNPFKSATKVPDASAVPANWPYNGRPYRVLMSGPANGGPADGASQAPLHLDPASTGAAASTGVPSTPASQHQSAQGTPQSQSSAMGGLSPAAMGASSGPMQPQGVPGGGAGGPMGPMGGNGPHSMQQGQAPFGMVYQQPPQGPGGPYRFPPQQPMQGQYYGVHAMGMPVGPPMPYGVPQPGMPPQFIPGGGHGGHPGVPHGHALSPGQHQMQHQMNQQHQQQQHGGGPHGVPSHHGPPMGLGPHPMQYGSPPIAPQQQQQGVPMVGGTPQMPHGGPASFVAASPQIGSGPTHNGRGGGGGAGGGANS